MTYVVSWCQCKSRHAAELVLSMMWGMYWGIFYITGGAICVCYVCVVCM